MRKLDGQEARYDGRRVACHLLTREGGQILILRYRTVDGSKAFVRLFSAPRRNECRFTELRPSHRILLNRLGAFALENWYSKNSELAPPFKFPSQNAENALAENTSDGA